MNIWQALKQLEYLIRLRTWGGSGGTVFPSVRATSGILEDALRTERVPMVLIAPMDATTDPDGKADDGLLEQRIELTLIMMAPGDALGQKALLGGNRNVASTFGQGVSEGRGLLECETELLAAVKSLNNLHGVRIKLDSVSASGGELDQTTKYTCFRKYQFRLMTSDVAFYHPAHDLVATPLGGGSCSLSWKIPAARWDRYRVILRRAAGSTPPTSITDGIGVTLSGDLATSVTDSPGAGTFSYALFTTYDEINSPASQDQRVSDAVSRAGVVLT
jgi:hypothetical protein